MEQNPEVIEKVVSVTRESPRYRFICEELIRHIATQELSKGRSIKEAVKATRNKLHQVGGAYQEKPIVYSRWEAELANLPDDKDTSDVKAFCRRMQALHASTSERLPILESFYQNVFADLSPVRSILDLACGLNPLAIPWMPVTSSTIYHACDIYADMTGFVNKFLSHIKQSGKAEQCDLTQLTPQGSYQIALLLKTLPCLEQIDKNIGENLLDIIPAEYILVSFPISSLGGRDKGMRKNYQERFVRLTQDKKWSIKRFEFATELAFLVKKGE